MANQPWLDEVRQRLAKHALPPSYVQRFTEELSDHLEDLKEENMTRKLMRIHDWANRNKWPTRPLLPIGGAVFSAGIPRRRSWSSPYRRSRRWLSWSPL